MARVAAVELGLGGLLAQSHDQPLGLLGGEVAELVNDDPLGGIPIGHLVEPGAVIQLGGPHIQRLLWLHLWVNRVVCGHRLVVCALQGSPDAGIPTCLLAGVDHDHQQIVQVRELEEGAGPGWRAALMTGACCPLVYRCHCIALRLLSLASSTTGSFPSSSIL
ncbi:hypothetical protein D3C84_122630 [compost metagenome]